MDEIRKRIVLAHRVLEAAYDFYLTEACPCAFSRFWQLVGFKYEDVCTYPVSCFEQDYVVSLGTSEKRWIARPAVYLPTGPFERIEDSNHRHFQCAACGTAVKVVYTQYSTNLDRVFMVPCSGPIRSKTIGKPAEAQVRVVVGIHGFRKDDLEKCKPFFRWTSESEMLEYLTAKQPVDDALSI
jgi:hypothetical protein